ncbi:Transition state regulatory protein AbrB [compost metagenome]
MKSTGMVRNVDDLGRVVLPKELRKNLDINVKDPLEIFVDGDSVILKKLYKACCAKCTGRVGENDKHCKYCGNKLKEEN